MDRQWPCLKLKCESPNHCSETVTQSPTETVLIHILSGKEEAYWFIKLNVYLAFCGVLCKIPAHLSHMMWFCLILRDRQELMTL